MLVAPVAAPRPSAGSGSSGGAMMGGAASGSPSSGGGAGAGHVWGLRERVVGVESLLGVAQELRAAQRAITVGSGAGARASRGPGSWRSPGVLAHGLRRPCQQQLCRGRAP
jgi:hypothetical protein